MRAMKRFKFINMIHAYMTMSEYEQFISLVNFAIDLNLLEADKATMFEDNHNLRCKGLVRLKRLKTLRDSVGAFRLVDKGTQEAQKAREAKLKDKVDEKTKLKKQPALE